MKSGKYMYILLTLLLAYIVLAFNIQPARADETILYSVDHNLNLVAINPTTLSLSVVGHVGHGVEALCFSPEGVLFAAADLNAGLHMMADTLITIDRETATPAIIGPIGFGDVEGIAFGPDGTLYGVDTFTDKLIEINPMTGIGTAIGNTGFGFIGALAFSPDEELHGVSLAGPGGGISTLLRIDTSTGQAIAIGPIGFNTVEDIAFDQEGSLYGISIYLGGGTGELIQIDSISGVGSTIGKVGAGDFEGLVAYPPLEFAQPPSITDVSRTPATPNYEEEVTVTATITDDATVDEALLSHTYDETWYNVSMNRFDDTFSAAIPAQPYGAIVQYRIYANDTDGIWSVSDIYSYTVIDNVPPEIHSVQCSPLLNLYAEVVEPDSASGVDKVFLFLKLNDGNWWNTTLTYDDSLGLWARTIFGYNQLAGETIEYLIETYDKAGNKQTSEVLSQEVEEWRIADLNRDDKVDKIDILKLLSYLRPVHATLIGLGSLLTMSVFHAKHKKKKQA